MTYPIVRMSALAVAMMLAGTALAAPQAATAKMDAESPRHARWLALDTNNDGVIDRAEAGKHKWLAEKFDSLDRNDDGKLDRSELRRGHGKRGHRAHGRYKGRRMGHSGMYGGMSRYAALDTDGDGRISKLEADSSPRLASRFAEIDLNKDGYLVRSELQADRERRREEYKTRSAERFDQRFKEADSNGDGRLSRAEFEAAWPGKEKTFNFLDEDRDGYLTRADLTPEWRR